MKRHDYLLETVELFGEVVFKYRKLLLIVALFILGVLISSYFHPEWTQAVVIGGRVMDLKNPEVKMSKSQPETCLFLNDSPEEIRRKIKKANTNKDGLKNLKALYEEFVGGKMPKSNEIMKNNLAEGLIKKLEPVTLLPIE